MSLRVCSEPGCPTLVKAGRCTTHARQYEQARGTSTQRGYGSAHVRARADYQRAMHRGATFKCWRCGDPIDPQRWTLGHCDIDRSKYHGPECPPCDYATSGRTGCPHPSHH